MGNFQRLALAAAVATYLLIVLGAVVRVTGSGLGCPDWPLCHGRLFPPLEFTALVEYTHRLVAALDSALILAVGAGAWLFRRKDPLVLAPASLALLFLVAQIGLGAVTVVLELPPGVVLVHLGMAMLILGLLVWVTVAAGPPQQALDPWPQGGNPGSELSGLMLVTTPVLFLLLLTGAYVRASGASWACVGFPLCSGEVLPMGTDPLVDIHLLHRLTAYGVVAVLGVLVVRAWRQRSHVPALGWAALCLGGATLFQLGVGAGAVAIGVPAFLRGLHVAGAAAVWASTVALAALVFCCKTGVTPTERGSHQVPPQPLATGPWQLAAAFLELTKPGIIVLLLVTTLASMLVAAEGLPPLPLIGFTLLGGALAAGAANAFNCYLDRDIDQLMGRTSQRPLPAGIIAPWQALVFGGLLSLFSLLVLGVFVNWLAANLALAGLLYYVFVYTCWLKRSTPSNIVIGGAAGAVPPLVGWAAVTGEVSLLAVYLFAIVFFWTPPHFWALALLIRREYERARIPMLPIVRGDEETRHQILLYSLFLVAFTLLVVVFRQMGVFYLTSALLLGGVFVYHAARLLRDANALAARRLFRYSILYLALLFTAMVVDRWKVL